MSYPRPDELASQAKLNRESIPQTLVKAGTKLAAGYGATSIASKILPFLSEYITPDLALKGISKVNPAMGNFLKKGLEQGLDLQDGLNFLKDKISNATQLSPSGFPIKNKEQETKSKSEKPKEEGNIVKKYSDKLHSFIEKEINGGRPVLEAGAVAILDKDFKKIIKKMEKDYQTNWSDILLNTYQDAYGNQNMKSVTPQQPQPQQPIAGTQAPQQPQQPIGGQQMPQQPQGQIGPAQQALMQAIQRLQQIRGGGAR